MPRHVDNDVLRSVAAVVIAVVIGVVFGRPPPAPEGRVVAAPVIEVPATEAGRVTVHVSGAVVSPGLVEVSDRSRVADAIAAAGGVTDSADLAAINLADPVVDGRQVVVPSTGSLIGGDRQPGPAGKVRLNTADALELERLPGVGPVLAEKIIGHRDEFGPFATVEDLLDVSGIGERKLASIRDLVVVP